MKKIFSNILFFFKKIIEINKINKIKPRFVFYSENKTYIKYSCLLVEYLSKKFPGEVYYCSSDVNDKIENLNVTNVYIGKGFLLQYFFKIINTDNLRGVVVTSETVTQYDIDMVESVFKAPCILEYGMAETGVIAYSKEKTSNIKVFWDSFLCQKTFENQLLVSTLTDKLFPLINYDTGDIIDSSDNKSILTLHKIIGRSNDFITIFDEGQRKIIHSEFFTHVLKSIPSILDFRIKQKLDLSIVVSYVCSDTKEISQTFYTEVKKEYKNIQINQFSFFKVSFIPPTKSGKAKLDKISLGNSINNSFSIG